MRADARAFQTRCAAPGTGIRIGHADETKAPGRLHRASPAVGAIETGHRGGLRSRNQARWLPTVGPQDGDAVRLFSRNGSNLASRFPAIMAAALKLKAERFIIDGEAVVPGPPGLSRFDELCRREGRRRQSLISRNAFRVRPTQQPA
jgi:hypothetical protein